MRLTFLSLLLTLFIFPVHAQTYVNREWVSNFGSPDSIRLISTTTSAASDIISVSNTYVSGEHADILITKTNSGGTLQWQTTWNDPINLSDYGAAVATDAAGYIYVAGIGQYAKQDTFDIVILKYDPAGTLIWQQIYDGSGLNDYASRIKVDGSGYVYVTGATENSSSKLDYLTLKLDPYGSLQWAQAYDYNGNNDMAGDVVTDGSGNVIVTGGSEYSLGNWDYTTLLYSSSGSLVNADRVGSGAGELKQPHDIVKDNLDHYYITGTFFNGTDNDVKIIKLDSTLHLVWAHTYNGGNEGSNSIVIDSHANLYVGGWQDGTGSRNMLILKYDSAGNEIWAQSLASMGPMPYSEITAMQVTPPYLYLIGKNTDSLNSDIITASIDDSTTGTFYWTQDWTNSGSSIDLPTSIYGDESGVYVSGSTTDGAGKTHWVTFKYTTYNRDTTVAYDSTGRAIALKNAMIVGFDPRQVKKDMIDGADGSDIVYGTIGTFLKPILAGEVMDKIGADVDVKMLKIFKTLKTTDTVTLSRLDDTVRIPPFWSQFELIFPDGTNMGRMADSLNKLFPLVQFINPEPIPQLLSSNDSLYPKQWCLNGTDSFPNFGINMDSAWALQSGGKKFVHVGVVDGGIFWWHADFGYDSAANKPSDIVGGWCYIHDVPTFHPAADLQNHDYHGTAVASIIGAVRNNNMGIAGIAGRDASSSVNKGVSLYAVTAVPHSPFSGIADALVLSCLDTTMLTKDSTYSKKRQQAFAVNILNNSWGFHKGDLTMWYSDSNLTFLRQAVAFVNKLGVTFTAALGNAAFDVNYPGLLDDDWILTVGGTGLSGQYVGAARSSLLDVAAPFDGTGIQVLSCGLYPDRARHDYRQLSGTSMSTPMVSGVAGLLMSYYNDTFPSKKNLSPEDIEHIITMTATDVGQPGRDSLTGWGRLNAGAALYAINKDERKLMHISGRDPSGWSFNFYPKHYPITLTEDYLSEDTIMFKAGRYKAREYFETIDLYYHVPTGYHRIAVWPRHSASEMFPVLDTITGQVIPREKIKLGPVNDTSVVLYGAFLQVFDTADNFLGWLPFDPLRGNVRYKPNMAASILFQKNHFTNIEKQEYGETKLYPNPASSNQTLEFNSNTSQNTAIALYDITGRKIKDLYKGRVSEGKNSFRNDLNNLPPGMYIYRIQTEEGETYVKTLKLNQ